MSVCVFVKCSRKRTTAEHSWTRLQRLLRKCCMLTPTFTPFSSLPAAGQVNVRDSSEQDYF